MIWEQGAIDVIPPKANRKLPAEFDAEIYRERNKIERFFGRLKASFRRIATRYEKTSRNFLSMIKLASIRLWIEFYESALVSNREGTVHTPGLADPAYRTEHLEFCHLVCRWLTAVHRSLQPSLKRSPR